MFIFSLFIENVHIRAKLHTQSTVKYSKYYPRTPAFAPPLATASGSAFVRVRVTAALAEFCSLRELLR